MPLFESLPSEYDMMEEWLKCAIEAAKQCPSRLGGTAYKLLMTTGQTEHGKA